jgi:hypothetical protein
MPKDTIGPGEPAIGFSIDCKLNDRRAFVTQAYLPIDASSKEINQLLDKLFKTADRQETRYRLKDMRLLLEKNEKDAELQLKDLTKYEEDTVRAHNASERRQAFAWKGNLATNRDSKIQAVAMTRVTIERIKKGIAEAEAELLEE